MKTLFNPSSDSTEGLRVLQILAGFLLVLILQGGLSLSKMELPQKSGTSLMTLISDDTRDVISCSLMDKVESYFHGGIDVDNCSMEDAAEDILHEGEEPVHGENCNHARPEIKGFSPVVWINSHIHAQEHRHLSNNRSVELLPWIAAASRVSPHNLEAYQIGSYVLSKMADKPQAAVDFLQEGIKNNPEDFELEVSLAEMWLNVLKDQEKAQEGFERALTKSLAIGRELTVDEIYVKMKIYFYLGVIAKENGDLTRLREVYQMALKENPQNIVTRSLAEWLAEAGSINKE